MHGAKGYRHVYAGEVAVIAIRRYNLRDVNACCASADSYEAATPQHLRNAARGSVRVQRDLRYRVISPPPVRVLSLTCSEWEKWDNSDAAAWAATCVSWWPTGIASAGTCIDMHYCTKV